MNEQSVTHENLESAPKGKLNRLEFGSNKSSLAYFIENSIETASNILITFPGIGTASDYDKNRQLGFYYGLATKKLVDDKTSVISLMNWPGYQVSEELSTKFKEPNIHPASIHAKALIMNSLIDDVMSHAQPSAKLVVAAHSTAGEVLIREADTLTHKYSHIKLIAESPSGGIADSDLLDFSNQLVKLNLMGLATRIQQKLPSANQIIEHSYGLPKNSIEQDAWLVKIAKSVDNAKIVPLEMKESIKSGPVSIPNIQNLFITVGEKDTMVNVEKLSHKFNQLTIFNNVGHLVCRQPEGITQWVNNIRQKFNQVLAD